MTDTPAVTDAPKNVFDALARFQADPPQVVKDQEADVKTKDGRHAYSYKYLSLQALLDGIRPRLAELGLVWVSIPTVLDGKAVLRWFLRHNPSGTKIGGAVPLNTNGSMQEYGSTLSFARRYAIIAALNVAPDVDEDGAQRNGSSTVADDAKPITKRKAEELVKAADSAGLMARLRLAASHVHGEDVGECDTQAKAVEAVRKLTAGEVARLFARIQQISEGGDQS